MTKSTFFEIVVSEHRNYATIKSTEQKVDFPMKIDMYVYWELREWFVESIERKYKCRLEIDRTGNTFFIKVSEDAFFCPALLQKRFADLCAAESALFDHINFLFTPKF